MNVHAPTAPNDGWLEMRLAEGKCTPETYAEIQADKAARKERAARVHFKIEAGMHHLRRAAALVDLARDAWVSRLGNDPSGTLDLAIDLMVEAVNEVAAVYFDEDDAEEEGQ